MASPAPGRKRSTTQNDNEKGEKDPLLDSITKQRYESFPTLAEDEIAYSKPETKAEYYQRWFMLTFSYAMQFLLIVQNTAYSTVLWPYLQQIDPTADETFFGLVLGAFSLASTFSNPLLGYMSNRMQQTRVPLMIGFTATILGNMGTVFADSFTVNAKYALLCFRFVTGIGGGCLSVIFSYITMCSTLEERNTAVALRSATASASFLIGPGISSLFSIIGYPGVNIGILSVNMFTAPALFSIFSMILALAFVVFCYKDYWVSVHPSEMRPKGGKYKQSKIIRPYDMVPVIVLIFVRFTLRFSTAYDQAIGSPFTMTMFHWNAQEAIRYNGIIQSATGALDFFGNIFIGVYVLKHVRYRTLLPIGLASFLLFFFFSFSYPSLPPMIDQGSNVTKYIDCLYSWCEYTTRVYLWQYILAYVSIFAAFSITYSPANILYSKVFGPRKQGLTQGVYVAASQLAAAIAPIVVTNLFQYYGPRIAWTFGASLIVVTLIVVLSAFSRLVTFEERLEKLGLNGFIII